MTDLETDELLQILRSLRYLAKHRGFGQHVIWCYDEHRSATDKVVRELTSRGVDVGQI